MDSTGLEQMICFELHAASRAMTTLYRPALEPHGITYPQYTALTVIWHRGSTTVGDLGKALALDSGTLSPLLKRLETQGLITRTRNPHDERSVTITTTAAGTALRDTLAGLPHRLACTVVLSTDDLTTLHHLLARIRAAGPLGKDHP